MYKGLPIVTNKIPEDERNGIPHHLLDQIGLREAPWTVHEFVEESSGIIDAIRGRGKLPVVVGGTSYYIYSLLFRDTIITADSDDAEGFDEGGDKIVHSSPNGASNDEFTHDLLEATTEDLYRKLRDVDPEMASRWHPKDRRKIQRSLEIWLKSGRKPSEIYAEQANSREFAAVDDEQPGAKYDPLVFWLDADDAILKTRLNERVDKMVDQGLLEEVKMMRDFEGACNHKGTKLDQSKGIWVAIGYKQLAAWLDAIAMQNNETVADDAKKIKDLQEMGVEAVKSATRQYAKRQDRWIRLRFAKGLQNVDAFDRLFLLDGTDLADWSEKVEGPALKVLKLFLQGDALPSHKSLSDRAAKRLSQLETQETVERQAIFCDVCNKTLMSEQEWLAHLKSQSHKKVQAGIRKRALRDEYLAKAQAG